MKLLLIVLTALAIVGCQSTPAPAPPVTESLLRAGIRQKADGPTLAEGRKVFVNRCIVCHALPDVSQYNAARLPGIVSWMSGRAHLSPEQKDALTKYLVTVRSQ